MMDRLFVGYIGQGLFVEYAIMFRCAVFIEYMAWGMVYILWVYDDVSNWQQYSVLFVEGMVLGVGYIFWICVLVLVSGLVSGLVLVFCFMVRVTSGGYSMRN